FWEPPNFTFPFGAHIVVTDIDSETGQIKVRRYVAVDDCGNILNPLIVSGQVHGGVAQGLGQALWEQAVYGDNGQLITGELTDYALPRAIFMPWIESSHTETPSPVNPLGVKGVGEAGTIGCSPAVVNSVVDARLASAGNLVDLGRVPGLNQIAESGGTVRIGAMATHHEIENSPVVRGKCPLLAETASHIGDIQVRNRGTVGGSVAHADPQA